MRFILGSGSLSGRGGDATVLFRSEWAIRPHDNRRPHCHAEQSGPSFSPGHTRWQALTGISWRRGVEKTLISVKPVLALATRKNSASLACFILLILFPAEAPLKEIRGTADTSYLPCSVRIDFLQGKCPDP